MQGGRHCWVVIQGLSLDCFLVMCKRYVLVRLICCLKYGPLLPVSIPCIWFSHATYFVWVSLSCLVFPGLLWLLLCSVDVHLIHSMLPRVVSLSNHWKCWVLLNIAIFHSGSLLSFNSVCSFTVIKFWNHHASKPCR